MELLDDVKIKFDATAKILDVQCFMWQVVEKADSVASFFDCHVLLQVSRFYFCAIEIIFTFDFSAHIANVNSGLDGIKKLTQSAFTRNFNPTYSKHMPGSSVVGPEPFAVQIFNEFGFVLGADSCRSFRAFCNGDNDFTVLVVTMVVNHKLSVKNVGESQSILLVGDF